MLNRRQFLTRTLQGSSLLAVGTIVPQFLVNTARAIEPGKDSVLVIVELTGGNDGLNTVIPYGDDNYHKARPTLGFRKAQVVTVDDHIGLHPSMRGLDLSQLAIVQGVGYPNPDRSHFESMDVWQSGDPARRIRSGWIGRSVADLQDKHGGIPVVQVGANRLPLALQGSAGGVVSVNAKMVYHLDVGVDPDRQKPRRQLIEDLSKMSSNGDDDLLQFVQRRELQTYTTLDKLQEVLQTRNQQGPRFGPNNQLVPKMELVADLIRREFGTRVYYVSLDGFDTHARQAENHGQLLGELANGISFLFQQLKASGHDQRVLVMTFSEFGRRVLENGSKGTDHGSGSCLFVAGPAAKAGAVTKHPSLEPGDLDSGDVHWKTDFRQVYATLLDRWLGVDSKLVLGTKFEHLPLLKKM